MDHSNSTQRVVELSSQESPTPHTTARELSNTTPFKFELGDSTSTHHKNGSADALQLPLLSLITLGF